MSFHYARSLKARVGLRVALLFGAAFLANAAQAVDLTVSAAASLTNAFKEVATQFEGKHPGTKVLLNFAASDALLQQIAAGAPVDVLATADQESLDKAAAQNLIANDSRRNFAGNELVLVTPSSSTLALHTLADLKGTQVKHLALGNPASVPAGRYAQHALEKAGLWPLDEGKAILTQSVRQALDYVARGEVDAGLVYATDALSQKDKVKVAATVPTETPVVYPVAVLRESKNAALAADFVAFLTAADGQAILARHGFKAP